MLGSQQEVEGPSSLGSSQSSGEKFQLGGPGAYAPEDLAFVFPIPLRRPGNWGLLEARSAVSGRAAAWDGWLSVGPVSGEIRPRVGRLSPLSWFPSTLPWKNSQSNRPAGRAVSTSKPRSCPQGKE